MSEPPNQPGPSLLKISLIIGVFFLIVFVIAALMLPDHGKSLLKLTANSSGALHACVASALLN